MTNDVIEWVAWRDALFATVEQAEVMPVSYEQEKPEGVRLLEELLQ